MIPFEEWSKTAEVAKKYTDSLTWSVDIWRMPDGTELAEHTRFKGFLSPMETVVIVQIPFTAEEADGLACDMSEGEDAGLWFPTFRGDDSLREAYNFVNNWRSK